MLLRSCCIRSERTASGSLRRRSWYSGHATNMCSSSSLYVIYAEHVFRIPRPQIVRVRRGDTSH